MILWFHILLILAGCVLKTRSIVPVSGFLSYWHNVTVYVLSFVFV
jgi:hypothetical protein